MKITGIKIRNFKCIKEIEIDDLKPIVGLWGKNGAGKSSIIQSLVVLRNAALYGMGIPNIWNQHGIFLGDSYDIAYKHEPGIIYIEETFNNGKKNMIKITMSPHIHLERRMEVKEVAGNIRYFPPWRRIATKTSPIGQLANRDFGENAGGIHTFIHWFIHRKLYNKLNTGKENELDRINMWAKKLGYGDILDEQTGHEVMGMYKDTVFDTEVSIINGGYGGNTFLPIIFEGYSFTDGILLIEEPEISLHPGAQSEILDFFLEMYTKRDHQIIFTSHSEYLLRKIVRYYADGKITKDLVDILYVWRDKDGTHVERKDIEKLKDRFSKGACDILPELTKR